MKLLVTGGAGFIGSNFIRYWVQNHPLDSIINLDLLTYAGNPENLKDIDTHPHYEFVHGDICDRALVDSVVKKVDIIVHFAAETHVDRSILDPAPFIRTNIMGTYTLLESALKNGNKRFHHISTDEVFGSLSLKSSEKFTLNTPYNPRSPYSASKASSDHLVRSYGITFGLPITISNCSNNFGPFQFPEKLIPLAISHFLEKKAVPIYGDGKYVRDWLFVEDHCEAIDCIIQKGTQGETYLVGGLTEDISNLEIIEKIAQIMHTQNLTTHVSDRPGHDRRYAIDWSSTQALGWKPRHSFEEALIKTVEWYTKHKSWWKRVISGEYQQYYKKQYGSS